MSYNSAASAGNLVGQSITSELLDVARSIIDSYSEYRWEETEVTEYYSGNGEDMWLSLKAPIISVDSLEIDDVEQTEDTDFEVRHIEGMIRCYSGLPWGHDNIVITYSYGWTSDGSYGADSVYNATYSKVAFAEAAIALYLKKNPLMLNSVNVEGLTANFGDNALLKLLESVPQPISFAALGPQSTIEPWYDTLL